MGSCRILNASTQDYQQSTNVTAVMHHTALLAELMRMGELAPVRPVPDKVTYYDPAYLGGHNGICHRSRFVLSSVCRCPRPHILN